jgi:hypothetical protein
VKRLDEIVSRAPPRRYHEPSDGECKASLLHRFSLLKITNLILLIQLLLLLSIVIIVIITKLIKRIVIIINRFRLIDESNSCKNENILLIMDSRLPVKLSLAKTSANLLSSSTDLSHSATCSFDQEAHGVLGEAGEAITTGAGDDGEAGEEGGD